MRVMKFLRKNGFGKRVVSMMMAFLMMFTMFAGQLPGGLLEVKAANTYDVTVHWQNTKNWSKVNAYVWNNGGTLNGGWPGSAASKNEENAGWYDVSFRGLKESTFNFIFNNGSTQTVDIKKTLTSATTEFWATPSGTSGGKITANVTTTAPAGWVVGSSEEPESIPDFISPEVNGNKVTFRYYDPNASYVALRGTMNGWGETPMTKGDDGVWSITRTLDKGDYEYKFYFGGDDWRLDPKNDQQQNSNSYVYVANVLTVPEFISPEVNGNEVTFRYYDPDASYVALRGTMNDWGETPMTKGDDDVWSVTQTLVAGEYEYKFYFGGEDWRIDAKNNNQANGNSVVLVKEAEPEIATYDVTLHVYNKEGWEKLGLYAWDHASVSEYSSWPGKEIVANAADDTWYDYTLEDVIAGNINIIVNNMSSDKQTSDLVLEVAENATEFWIVTGNKHANEESAVYKEKPEIEAPKPEETEKTDVTFTYKNESASSVKLAGTMTNWGDGAIEMTKGANGVWSLTIALENGVHQYKLIVDGNWINDPANNDGYYDGNNIIGVDTELGTKVMPGKVTFRCYAPNAGTVSLASAMPDWTTFEMTKDAYGVWSITKELEEGSYPYKFIVDNSWINDSSNQGPQDKDGNNIVVVEAVKPVISPEVNGNEVTFRYQSDTAQAVYLAGSMTDWDTNKKLMTKDENGVFTITLSLTDGKYQYKFVVDGSWVEDPLNNGEKVDDGFGGNNSVVVVGNVVEEPTEVRYLLVEYTRDDKDYADTNVYVWANGLAANDKGYPFEEVNGKYIAKVPVAMSQADMTVGFIVRKGSDWSYAVKDGGDNNFTFPADQKVVKIEFYNAKVTNEYPGNKGSEINRAEEAVTFYFRDDEAFVANTLADLDVKVVVKAVSKNPVGLFGLNNDINGTYTMTYDEDNARFVCNVPLVEDTDYYYYYLVDGVKVLDAFNAKTGTTDGDTFSMIRNRTYEVEMSASIKNASMDYNDNNLLTVNWAPKAGEDLEGFVVKELYADLSELGLGKAAIDPELKALSIACDDSVFAGTKTITVVLVDDCDAEYKATVDVTVTERTKAENTEEKLGDFDWDEAVIYFAVTDRFYDGNKANNTATEGYNAADTTDGSRIHGGDLAGLTEKMDYLYDLGINTIWLTPIVDNIDQNVREADSAKDGQESYGYHGYWASDFTKLNPHLGTEAELKALVDAAHAKGMKVMVDVVLNHAGYGAEEHFNTVLKDADGNYITMIRDAQNTVAGDNILASLSGLPDFVTENEAVRNQLIEWQTKWVKEFGIDYYRVDTVKHVDSTTWAAFKNALTEINPEFKLIGEYYGANYTNATEQLNSGKMDALLDFDFKNYAANAASGNFAAAETSLTERSEALTNTATLGSFLSSHDEDGLLYTFMSKHGKEGYWAEAMMKVASTLQITAKGQPVIYYGEEIGLSGEDNYPVQDNRYDFDWDKLEEQKVDENSLYNHYKKMLNIRRDYSEVFAKGERAIVQLPEGQGYEIIRRTYEGTSIYVGMNAWGDDRTATFEVTAEVGSVYTDLYNNKTYTVAENGSLTITIPNATKGGTAVLVLTEGKDAGIVDTNEVTIKVHYLRSDNNYTDWNAWLWSDKKGGAGYEFKNENGEMVATIKVEGRSEMKVNYIIRKGEWDAKDVDADQSIDISDIVSGTVHFYVKSGVPGGTRILGADAIKGSKIVSAKYDREKKEITIVTSTPVTGELKDAFAITCTDGTKLDITKVTGGNGTYTVKIKQDISSMKDVLKSYVITYKGYEYTLAMPNLYSSKEFESQYTYEGDDLGATWSKASTTFKVWAPTADAVKVALYKSGTEGTNDRIKTCDMTLGEAGVWSVTVAGDLNGKYYTYLVTVNGETEEACDPYARTTGVNGKRAMVLNLDATDPKGWNNDVSPNKGMEYTDAIIYELHVRDASIDESSGVSEANKGKFLGLTETGTKTEGGVSTALDHISDLGVTHVHLLPVYDFGSVDETKLDEAQFNWGYDPVNYNVPEGSYSTNPYDGATRVKEMKEMVMALHENNINVVMDVVYNHVYDAGSFCFNEIVPNYFSRTRADGSFSNGSGCGNDTASERAMVQKYIVDSVMYWAEEYHIDGFRFDLVGLLDTETMNAVIETVHEKYPDVIFYGEGWTMGTDVTKENVTMSTQLNATKTPELAYFSDTIRDLIAGNNTNGQGFVNGIAGKENDIANCFKATTSWCPSPTQTVNYASCHDNYTLMDKLNEAYSSASASDRIKMNNLSASIYMMSQGIPFIHAGEEFLRTKVDENGEVIHNSYKSSDYVNALRWDNIEDETYADVVDYYAGLIEFRKNHEALRLTSSKEVANNVIYKKVSNNVLLFDIAGKDAVEGEVSDGIIVIYNANKAAKTFSLYDYGVEKGEWKVCINAEDAGIEVLDTITDGKVTVDAISAMVLVKGETVDTDSVYLDNYREPSVDDKDDTTGSGNGTSNQPSGESGNVSNITKPETSKQEAPVQNVVAESATDENTTTVVRPQTQQTTTSENEAETAPEEEESVVIEEEETPLDSGSEESEKIELEIPEEDVPLAAEEASVNVVPVVIMLTTLAALIFVGVLLIKKGTIKLSK